MKSKVLIIYFTLFTFIMISCEQDSWLDPKLETVYPDQSVKSVSVADRLAEFTEGTVITLQIYSPSLEGNLLGDPAVRNVNVYLPKGYSSNQGKRFPVIYYLHGFPSSENSLLDPIPFEILRQVAFLQAPVDFPEEGFTSWMNDLIENGGMRETIIVMANAASVYGLSFYTNSVVQGNYEDYISDDLVAFIDQNFRTIPNFNYRALAGHSAGGYGALKIAMKHPKVFRHTAGLSPGIFPNEIVYGLATYMALEDMMTGTTGPSFYDPSLPFKFFNNGFYSAAAAWIPNPQNPPYYVDIPFTYVNEEPVLNEELMSEWNSHSLFNLAINHVQGLEKLEFIYIDCGTNDDLMMYPPNLALHNLLLEMNINHRFEAYEGTHFSHLYDRLGKVFVELSNGFPEDD